MALMFFLLSCTADDSGASAGPPPPMETHRLASRVALDLIGRRPTEVELDALEADPASIDAQIATWLADPGFEERVVSMYADVFRSRADHYVVGADGDAEFADLTYKANFMRSVGEEPLRVMGRVAAEDLPWTTIVTSDWSMGNDYLLRHFPMEADNPTDTGWRPVHYIDGRPAVGVLATNGMWWRYTSTGDNRNRGRAAAIGRILLCDTRYDQPVDFNSGDPSLPSFERLAADPTCVGCHSTLEPLASTLYGFWRNHPESYTEALRYYPSRERDWESYTGTPPGYYGADVDSLHDLGPAIASDARFANCAIEQAWGFFLGRPPGVEDSEAFTADREAFIAGGLTYRSLVTAVIDNPLYRSDEAEWAGTTAPRRLEPDLLASAVEALTGYRWEVEGGVDAMVNDDYGFRVLNGGVDGILVTDAPESDSATIALVQERLAEAASDYAVVQESALDAGSRTLLREVSDLGTSPSDADARAQLAALVRRIHGRKVAADSEDVTDLLALYRDLELEAGSAQTAWAHTVSALLRHPDFVYR